MPENMKVCRLCLSKEGLMFPIFRNRLFKNETSLRAKIMSVVPIEVYVDDGLPSRLCHLCLHLVEKFFHFQEVCESSNATLLIQLHNKSEISKKEEIEMEKQLSDTEGKYTPSCHTLNSDKSDLENFTCYICNSEFSTNDLLIEHFTKNHSLYCQACKISFTHLGQFKNHISCQHNFSCSHCDCVFQFERNLQKHLKTHSKETYSCKYCKKAFFYEFELKKHECMHSENTCTYCLKEYSSKNEYNMHLKECDKKYYCRFCQESFELKKDLIHHVNINHDSSTYDKGSDSQKTFTAGESEDHCFQCQYCRIIFTSESSLVSHMSTEHKDELYICKFCGKKFNFKSSLRRHEKSHSGIKPYQCKFCPRKFKDNSACVVHTRTHTGEHPFRCQECHKDFKQLANLKMHTYRHHVKNKNPNESKSDYLEQGGNDYNLYSGVVMESYSGENMREYENINPSVPENFNQCKNILVPEHSQG